ncbi:hypothetical protein [Marinilactibacillus kalidii]|nr:hypothetical protein [Marinilactibacillus kalidii]
MNLILLLLLTGFLTVIPAALILVALNQPKAEKVKVRVHVEDDQQYPHR